jgi:hypothetical protein
MAHRPWWSKTVADVLAVLAGLVAAAGTLGVSSAGFILSFVAIRDVATWAHITPRWAWMLPVAVDGAMATATVAAVVLHRLGRPTAYPWTVVLTGAAISIACNALHAWAGGGSIALPRLVAMAVSAVPPALLAMSVHLLVLLVDAASRRVADVATPQQRPVATATIGDGRQADPPDQVLDTGPDTQLGADPAAPDAGHRPPQSQATEGDPANPGDGRAFADWPVDLFRRLPVNPEPYQQWQQMWRDLQAGAEAADVATRYGYNLRTVQFVRRAGQVGLLDSPVPPARLLAELATSNRHDDQQSPPQPTPSQQQR